MTSNLPVEPAIKPLLRALAQGGQAVLQAPPGAGKTTRVPLALLEHQPTGGKIIMLEPRRLAARAAAQRMADTLGESVGQTVGYRVRGDSKTSKATQIEVVTEGILTRMIQSDPGLSGIGTVIFDEFHERSLHADLGLALVLEARAALRDDLRLLVMSATLDAAPVAALMGDAPVITAKGHAFDVTTHWLDRPWAKSGDGRVRFDAALADLVLRALRETNGGLLVFAPGAGEVHRVKARLLGQVPAGVIIHPLYGAMDFKSQRAALAPVTSGRKIVIATSIAETSLTIDGITCVVDGGLARRARFDPASGMSRLVTEKVTKSEATQRRGRAGRVAPGHCYRLWTKGEDSALSSFPPPEIQSTDLAPLVLELALWGARDADQMAFLDPPNAGAFSEAQALLRTLNALDRQNRITDHGGRMARIPLHPRLAHMMLAGGDDAAILAALLADRDPLRTRDAGAVPADLGLRIKLLGRADKDLDPIHRLETSMAQRIRAEAKRLKSVGDSGYSVAELAALAYPDRIGLRREGSTTQFVLSNGKGAFCTDGDALGHHRLIVATDLDGDKTNAKIRLGIGLPMDAMRTLFADQITTQNVCLWSRRHKKVETGQQERFANLVLRERPWPSCPPQEIANAMIAGIKDMGIRSLRFGKPAQLLRARVDWLSPRVPGLPDFSDAGLTASLEMWLGPFLGNIRGVGDLQNLDLYHPLLAVLGGAQGRTLDRLAPAKLTAPTGTGLTIDYSAGTPRISVRIQEMFGLNRHPTVGPDQTPVLIDLLSPARRLLQTTSDLPGFWMSSYSDVRKDMRGRYPKHPWPENPMGAKPTRRVKPHKKNAP